MSLNGDIEDEDFNNEALPEDYFLENLTNYLK